MSIPENQSRKTKHQPPERPYPRTYLVPESQIQALVGIVRIEQMDAFAARMQVIADATKQPVRGPARNKLAKSELEQIKQVASLDKRKRYQDVMKAIIAAVERGGREGINLAHKTANQAVRLAFEWTPEHVSALNQYQDKLRGIRQRAKISS